MSWQTCPRCQRLPEVWEIAMMASGETVANPWPDWALALVRIDRETLQCPDCETRYREGYDQTHDHWWNDSWTTLTRITDP